MLSSTVCVWHASDSQVCVCVCVHFVYVCAVSSNGVVSMSLRTGCVADEISGVDSFTRSAKWVLSDNVIHGKCVMRRGAVGELRYLNAIFPKLALSYC